MCCCDALSHVYTGGCAHLWCAPALVHALTGVCSAYPRAHAVHTVHTHACTLSRARTCTLGQQAAVACACPVFRHAQSAPCGEPSLLLMLRAQGGQGFLWRLVGTAVPALVPSVWTYVKEGDRLCPSPPGAPGLPPESLLWLRCIWVKWGPCAPELAGFPLGGSGPACPGHLSAAQPSRVPARRGVRAGPSALGRPFRCWGSLLPACLPYLEVPGRVVRGSLLPCGWTETGMMQQKAPMDMEPLTSWSAW